MTERLEPPPRPAARPDPSPVRGLGLAVVLVAVGSRVAGLGPVEATVLSAVILVAAGGRVGPGALVALAALGWACTTALAAGGHQGLADAAVRLTLLLQVALGVAVLSRPGGPAARRTSLDPELP